ncbi:hypothetical protein BDAP_001577 [Binucleata daphniae]
MSNFLQTKEIHLTLTNMHSRISTSLTTSSSFSFDSITKYLNITLNQNKTYLLSCFSVPFINDIAYMLSELGITEENEFIVEYEEIDACIQKIQICDNIAVFETEDVILYGNSTGLYRITKNEKEMIYEGNVNEIASCGNEIYVTNNKNEIIKIVLDLEDGIQNNDENVVEVNDNTFVDTSLKQKGNDEHVEEPKKYEVIRKTEEKIRKICVDKKNLYYATVNGNVYEYNTENDKLLAQNIREITNMKVKDNKLYIPSLVDSFLYICLSNFTTTYIVKGFPATAFVFYNDNIYLSGTTGVARIIGTEASTFEVNIRFTDAICVWNNYIVFGGAAGVFVTHNNRLKSKILIENEFRGIGVVDNILYVATKFDIRGYTLHK